jgi:tRNA/tmRNA/rRNA uracil-C5-methylase (TrmA/RlmC/RlmD family)
VSTERLTVDVERLTFGFDALAHHDRQVVFVPYAAPGDRVVARVTERRRGWVRADIDTIVAPGPDRVLPGCPYFLTCGGCQWQHVAPPAQRAAKAAIVAEQLARIAGVRDAEVLPTLATEDWRYRARISLVVEGRRAGYHRARSHALVEVRDCPIADETVAAHLADARAWVAAVRARRRARRTARRRRTSCVGARASGARSSAGPGRASCSATRPSIFRSRTGSGSSSRRTSSRR